MGELFQHLLDWVGTNPGWAYFVVLLAAFAESLAIIGMVVPGVMIMLGAGALIATGNLDFWPTCLSAIAGAIVGDGFSYWLGYRYREHIRAVWPFKRYPEQLDQGVQFFQRYGAKSVVLGRFFGPVRAVVPLVAGIMQMAPRRFVLANVGSALAWAPAYLAPGIVFGASLQLAAEAAARLVILLLILTALVWISVWGARRLYIWLSPRAKISVQTMLRWADVHPKIGRIAQALADPAHPETPTLTGLAAALLAATALLGASAGLTGGTFSLNQIALDLGQTLHTPFADGLMLLLDQLGAAIVLFSLAIAVLLYLQWRGSRRDAGYWLAACGFGLLALPLLAWLLRIPRPQLGLALSWPWSFPSPAVLGATLSYGFLAIMLARGLPNPVGWIPYAAAAMLVLSIALARLYFGIEWLSDVIGSLALGLVWISALGLAFRRHGRRHGPGPSGLALVAIAAVAGGILVADLCCGESRLSAYLPHPPTQDISAAKWRAGGCELQPQQRRDLRQRAQRPFDIAYAGDPSTLASALAPLAWTPATRLSWGNALKLLSPSLPLSELPVIPHVHDGRHADLALIKDPDTKQRLALRLWRTGCRIQGTASVAVWVGMVTTLHKQTIAGLIALPVSVADQGTAAQILAADVAHSKVLDSAPGTPRLMASRASGLLSR